MGVLPKVGAIVASQFDHTHVKKGDLGLVRGVSSKSKALVSVAFQECTLDVFPYQIHVTPNLRVGYFVCSAIDFKLVKQGDIGKVVGISRDDATSNRIQVDFGHGFVVDLLESQTKPAPAVWGRTGSTVYSLIDHAHIKRGDSGKIVGPSTDISEKDRVAVRFGIDPTAYNFHETQVSRTPLEIPLKPISDLDSQIESLTSSLSNHHLRTEDVSLISHAHGRARRAERNILRRELQAAIKYGIKEASNPGRDGSPRWRYTYDGVVYITDETSKHEITSWRIDGEDAFDAVAPAEIELNGKGCHAVLIVDSSGSMRTSDVPGYESRAHAVYACLVRDFVKEQIKSGAAHDVVVTLISMHNEATVLIKTQPLDENLIPLLIQIGNRPPRSHGNYIPALDMALEIMTEDAPNRAGVFLLLFSDGAPSDQTGMKCEHGVPVFSVDRKWDPRMGHRSAGSAWACRKLLHDRVKRECLDRVKKIGKVFGRDKVILRTLGFGPPKEDFRLLSELADALPRGDFQKLGLDANKLKTAFSSLSSSMSELRTAGGGLLLTPRLAKVVDKQQKVDTSTMIRGSNGWWIYSFQDLIGKYEFDNLSSKLTKCNLSDGATGMAFVSQPFAEGAERLVFRCTEIDVPNQVKEEWYLDPRRQGVCDRMRAYRLGLRLVAKEAKVVENLNRGSRFHETFSRIQQDAASLALQFNQRLPQPLAEWNVTFLPTRIYCCRDPSYKDNKAWVLVEPELDGKFTKWNNNAGAVRTSSATNRESAPTTFGRGSTLGIGSMALLEEGDEEDDEEDVIAPIQVDDVPQAFSHFTYEESKGKQLVCDLQGVWNLEDGFVLTDPCVHYVCSEGKKHRNGATDKGLEGVRRFFGTHECNALCQTMGLPVRSPQTLL